MMKIRIKTNIGIMVTAWVLILAFIMLSSAQASAAILKTVDLIIHGRYVVTMNEDKPVIEYGAVAVKDGVIVAVGQDKEIATNFTAKREVAGKDRILMPGLVNGHTHTAMVLFRGMADDLPLMTWLQNYIFPMEAQFVDREFIVVLQKQDR